MGVKLPHGKGTFEEARVGPWHDECVCPAQTRTNTFAAVTDEKTTMRPLAKLLWTLVHLALLFSAFYKLSHMYCCKRNLGLYSTPN